MKNYKSDITWLSLCVIAGLLWCYIWYLYFQKQIFYPVILLILIPALLNYLNAYRYSKFYVKIGEGNIIIRAWLGDRLIKITDITNFVQKGNKLIITYRLGNLLLDEKIHMSRVSKFDREKLRSDIKTELHIYNPDILR